MWYSSPMALLGCVNCTQCAHACPCIHSRLALYLTIATPHLLICKVNARPFLEASFGRVALLRTNEIVLCVGNKHVRVHSHSTGSLPAIHPEHSRGLSRNQCKQRTQSAELYRSAFNA